MPYENEIVAEVDSVPPPNKWVTTVTTIDPGLSGSLYLFALPSSLVPIMSKGAANWFFTNAPSM